MARETLTADEPEAFFAYSLKDRAPDAKNAAELMDTLLRFAARIGASEVHLEPFGRDARARFSLDGLMHDASRYPMELHALLIDRLKAAARLRAEERFAVQEGAISFESEGEFVDARVVMTPLLDGEKASIGLRTFDVQELDLEAIGLEEADAEKIREAMSHPGLILAAGPDGSGRTTTLYAILNEMDPSVEDMATIEERIEHDLPGVAQTVIDPAAGRTFSAGSLDLLGQEPDVLMIGELRDEETSGTAAAAASACLVLSSLRADDAADALARFAAASGDPSRAAASVRLVVAQRLARRVCPGCVRVTETETRDLGLGAEAIRRHFGGLKLARLSSGGKCALCRYTGYLGRVGIFELLVVDGPIRKLVSSGADASAIRREAVRRGMSTMLEDGIRKSLSGLTTIEETLAVLAVKPLP